MRGGPIQVPHRDRAAQHIPQADDGPVEERAVEAEEVEPVETAACELQCPGQVLADLSLKSK